MVLAFIAAGCGLAARPAQHRSPSSTVPRPRYPSERAVTERVTAIGRARRVTAYLRTEAGTDMATGKPTLT